MSRTYSAIKNKHQKQSKHNYQEYIYSAGEPAIYTLASAPADLEAELLESSLPMRRKFRHLAYEMRHRYA